MLWNKLKITATFLLALAVAGVSAGGLLLPAPAAQEAQVPAPKEKGSDKHSEERTKQPGAAPKKEITPPADPPRKPSAAMIEAARQFQAIEEEWDRARQKYETALRGAKTKVARDAVAARDRPDPEPYAGRFLRLYREFPDTWGGAAALYWIACNALDAEAAGQALAMLKGGPIAHGDLDLVWGLFFLRSDPSAAPARQLAPLVYARAVREPRHPKAPDLLIWVCRVTAGDRSDTGSKLYREAGDRLVAESPDGMYAWRFAELLRDSGDPAWAERHLRTMLAKGKDPANRVAASFVLATLVQNKDEATQQEAERLYRFVVEEAARAADRWNQAALKLPESIHLFPDGDHWVRLAKAQLAEIKARGLGKPAPDLVGEDLDGKPMRLSDYRGKVVLVSFWATWCPPCMALVPHERELVKRMDGNRFAVVGVNDDKELTAAQKAAADKGITWRSFRNRAGSGPAISEAWAIAGWPTLYLIDHEGVIRRRWVGAPPNEVLSREVERLVAAAGHDR